MTLEYRVNWVGGITGPGVTVFHGRDTALGTIGQAAQELADRAATFLGAVAAGNLPDDITLDFAAEVVELNTSTGVLVAVHPVNDAGSVNGGVAGSYARPSGARVEWGTGAIVMGRRLRGRTFLVPVVSLAYADGGNLVPAVRASIEGLAQDYIDEPFGIEAVAPTIWSRTHGIEADIVTASVPSEVAILSSRRD
jgi:hypothetical protein